VTCGERRESLRLAFCARKGGERGRTPLRLAFRHCGATSREGWRVGALPAVLCKGRGGKTLRLACRAREGVAGEVGPLRLGFVKGRGGEMSRHDKGVVVQVSI
jgi:hypothetical protein